MGYCESKRLSQLPYLRSSCLQNNRIGEKFIKEHLTPPTIPKRNPLRDSRSRFSTDQPYVSSQQKDPRATAGRSDENRRSREKSNSQEVEESADDEPKRRRRVTRRDAQLTYSSGGYGRTQAPADRIVQSSDGEGKRTRRASMVVWVCQVDLEDLVKTNIWEQRFIHIASLQWIWCLVVLETSGSGSYVEVGRDFSWSWFGKHQKFGSETGWLCILCWHVPRYVFLLEQSCKAFIKHISIGYSEFLAKHIESLHGCYIQEP